MAKRDEQQRKVELLENLAIQRRKITTARALVADKVTETKEHYQQKLNVPKRIKAAVKGNPKKWFIVSAVGGLVLSKMIFGKKKHSVSKHHNQSFVTKSSNGIIATIAAFALKPMLKSFVINKVKDIVARKYLANNQQHQQLEYDERSELYTVE